MRHSHRLLALLLVLTPGGAFPASIEEQIAVCLACHGVRGQSATAEVPSLGGQPEFYLAVQLVMFREKLRTNEPMDGLLQAKTDDELRQMAAALAKLPAPLPDPEATDPSRAQRAQALIAQHRCNFCHLQDFSGEKNAPRLAGQREDYLLKALRGYKDNSRRAYDSSMADVMHPLTDTDLQDLAHYLARFE